jgi:MFS family permease
MAAMQHDGRRSQPRDADGEKLPMQKRRVWIYVLMFLLSAINYIDRSALSVAAGPLAHELNLDPVQLGYLFSSFLWLYVICLIPMGMVVDRLGSRTVNALGIALWSAATILTGIVGSFASLIATRVVMGVVFNSGAYFGPAIGGLVLASLVAMAGWRSAFFACGALGFLWLVAWLIWFRRPEQATWLQADERGLILRERDDPAVLPGQTQPSLGVAGLLRSPSLLGMMLTQGCAVYTQYLFLTWLPNYLQAARGISMAKSGVLTAMPYFGAVILTVLLGALSDKLLTPESVRSGGRRRMVALAMLVASVILLTPFVTNTYVILLLIMLALTGVATTVGLNIALLSDLLRSSADAGRATGLLILGGNVFGILAPIVTGYVIQATGSFDYAFAIAGLLLVCGALSALLLTRRPIMGTPDRGLDERVFPTA